MPGKSLIQRLQDRWGVQNGWQVLTILIVFAATGITASKITQPIFAVVGIDKTDPLWLRITVWMLTIFPAYQVLLLGYGFLFGQFTFFWNFEKKTFHRIKKVFTRKKIST